ncbi:hypothetical protein SAMN05443428_1335 [Caloramator quimbayensis]|uniref:Lipoprotein n=1 Tax=Caloramator quimbayensis TaxID=1147123 RepID=A0A1T4YAX1_9CLOT|nr:hypothetical protein [Caloramator quimbayensis]SKA98977.1 hypothetical protein SAMN05443428_1335 [Caloramator quimbayensis]
MKRNSYIFLVIMLALSILLSACSKSNAAKEESPASSSSSNAASSNIKRDIVIGKVDSILGNEVELSVADIPESMKQRLENMGNGNRQRNTQQNNSTQDSQNGTNISAGLSQNQGQGGFGQGRNFQNGNSQNRQRMQFNYTGEKKTIDIPVGVPIITTKFGTNGMERTEVQLSDIKEGNLLYIIYENGNIVEVRLMNTASQSQSTQ